MGVFKVWQFLDSWGIINYQAGSGGADDADGVPINVQPAGTDRTCRHLPTLAASIVCLSCVRLTAMLAVMLPIILGLPGLVELD